MEVMKARGRDELVWPIEYLSTACSRSDHLSDVLSRLEAMDYERFDRPGGLEIRVPAIAFCPEHGVDGSVDPFKVMR